MSTETSVKSVSREAPSTYAIQQGSAYLKVGDVGDSVLTCRGLLNQKGYSCNLTSETYDSVLKSVVAKFQKDFGLTSDGLLGQSSLAVLQDNVSDTEWLVDGVVNITAGKLARMGFGKEVLKPANVTALNEVCNRYHITSKTKVRHFLAQGFVETDKGRTFTEYIYVPGKTKSEYDKQYQRYAPYCGGGFMQLTWKDNYTAFYNYMKDTLKVTDEEIKSPAEYATQHVAKNYTFESAGWYWDVFKDINTKISQRASLSADATVTKVTQEINGGTNGLQARKDAYAKSKKIFGELLKEWTKMEKSIVMVSHDMEFTAKYADEISLLYQGEIIVQCPVREFMEENQFYTTGMNRVTRRVNPHIITIEDVKKYAKRKNSQ